MFDGKLEVRKESGHSLVMRGIEEERLLKLQGTSAHAHISHIFLIMKKVHFHQVYYGMLDLDI